MQFHAHIEPLTAVIRIFKENSIPWQDAYEFAATVVYSNDGKTAELKGVSTGGTSLASMRAVVGEAFWVRGVDTVKWQRRRRDGSIKRVYMDTRSLKFRREPRYPSV
jgi:hypothetical protein